MDRAALGHAISRLESAAIKLRDAKLQREDFVIGDRGVRWVEESPTPPVFD